MSGIFTRPAIDSILNNADLTPEQRREKIFTLYGQSLDDGYVSRTAAEEAKNKAVEAAKAGFKAPDPVDPKTTPEYMEVAKERDMLRAIGGDDFASVKPKFREQVYGMLDRGEKAAPVADQLTGIREKYEEYFNPAEEKKTENDAGAKSSNTPQYSQNSTGTRTNPESDEDKLVKQLSESWG